MGFQIGWPYMLATALVVAIPRRAQTVAVTIPVTAWFQKTPARDLAIRVQSDWRMQAPVQEPARELIACRIRNDRVLLVLP